MYIAEHPNRDPNVPGPGQYQIPGIVGIEASKYTMRPKTVDPRNFSKSVYFLLEKLLFKTQPGPGTYEPKAAFNEKGSYFVSKFKNSLATIIDPQSSVRFRDFSCKNE